MKKNCLLYFLVSFSVIYEMIRRLAIMQIIPRKVSILILYIQSRYHLQIMWKTTRLELIFNRSGWEVYLLRRHRIYWSKAEFKILAMSAINRSFSNVGPILNSCLLREGRGRLARYHHYKTKQLKHLTWWRNLLDLFRKLSSDYIGRFLV